MRGLQPAHLHLPDYRIILVAFRGSPASGTGHVAAELGAHRGDHTQDVVGAAARSLPGVKRRRGGRRGDAEFQRRFDVSRTVAREVAKSLETAKVVTVHRRIGLVSQPVEEWDALSTQVIHWKLHSTHRKEQLRTLTELRLAIEPAAATSAARYAPIDVKSRLPLLAAELRHTGENGRPDEFHKLDIEFHSLILRNSGNEMFASLSTIIATVLSGRVELHMYPQKPKPEALDAHDAVAQAIWQSSPDNARQAMHRIVDEVAETLQLS